MGLRDDFHQVSDLCCILNIFLLLVQFNNPWHRSSKNCFAGLSYGVAFHEKPWRNSKLATCRMRYYHFKVGFDLSVCSFKIQQMMYLKIISEELQCCLKSNLTNFAIQKSVWELHEITLLCFCCILKWESNRKIQDK